jgi:hypothetical protein
MSTAQGVGGALRIDASKSRPEWIRNHTGAVAMHRAGKKSGVHDHRREL